MVWSAVTRAERILLGLGLATWASYVAVAAGAPSAVSVVLSWLTALWAVGLVASRRQLGWLDGYRLVLVLITLWQLSSVYLRIGGDGIQYYILLRSSLLDFDLSFENDFRGLEAARVLSVFGEATSRMPIGAALTWAPVVALTHLVLSAAAFVGVDVQADGFSPPYHAAVTTTTLVLVAAAMLGLEAALRRRFGAGVALASVVGVWLASPLYVYAAANPSMSHGPQAAVATAFVLVWLLARQREDRRLWLLTGGLGGLLALVRPQDAVLLAMPALDLLLRGRRGLVPLAWLSLGPVLMGCLQLLVWIRMYGFVFADVISHQSYVGHTEPQVLDLIFSARHGLFTWTPIYALAAGGWLLIARRDRRLAGLVIVGFALSAYVNASMQDWWGSESFGQRRMLGLTPLFGLGLAAAFTALVRRPWLMLWIGLVALVAWNDQLVGIWNSQRLVPRTHAISLEQAAHEQVRVAFGSVMRAEGWLPEPVFFYLYENLKGVFLDEGASSMGGVVDFGNEPEDLRAVVGHNWTGPRERDGVRCRLSSGKKAWLRIPVRTPAAFEATLRARSELGDVPLSVAVEVNGVAVGEAKLGTEWTEARFHVPRSALRKGFNDVAFEFSTTRAELTPGFRGRNGAAVVDFLRMRRLDRRDGPV